jgi:hypothetical protein
MMKRESLRPTPSPPVHMSFGRSQEAFEKRYAEIFGTSGDMVRHVINIDAGFVKGSTPNQTVTVCIVDPLALVLDIACDVHRCVHVCLPCAWTPRLCNMSFVFACVLCCSKLSFEMPIIEEGDADIKISGMLSGLKFRQLAIELLQLLASRDSAYDPAIDKLIGLLFWSGALEWHAPRSVVGCTRSLPPPGKLLPCLAHASVPFLCTPQIKGS